jgi:hypothetical protein
VPLRLAAVRYRRFDQPCSWVGGSAITRYFADLAGACGVPCPTEEWRASGTAYADMARALLAEVDAEDAGVVVLAMAAPDLDPWRSAATRANHAVDGRPLLFAVTEQGSAAPYTALRLAGDLAGRHGLDSALVLAMDQATLPYHPLPHGATLAGDAAVALVLRRGEGRLLVGHRTGVSPGDLVAAVDELVPALDRPCVVAGPEVGPLPDRLPVSRRVPAGWPCTAGWDELRRPAVWIDHDPAVGELSVCVAR